MTLTYNPSWFVYLMMVVSGVTLVVGVSNWFFMWVGFELSLMGFLPMVVVNFLSAESMVKYFLVQAGGSGLFLVSFFWAGGMASLICLISVAMKLGLFPFYHWVPGVMSKLSWSACFFLVTVQKIPSFMVLCYLECYPALWLSSCSVLVGGVMGFNQTNLRSLMAYSSVSHGGWMGLCSLMSAQYLVLYFCLYFMVNLVLFFVLSKLSFTRLVQSSVWLGMSMLLFTLAGLPPFSIFFMKACVLFMLSPHLLSLVMVLGGSMCSIFYYLMIMIPSGVVVSSRHSFWGNLGVLVVCLNWPTLLLLGI